MFTGLIETVGQVTDNAPRSGSRRIGIASKLPLSEMNRGASVSVDGVCLTVTDRRGDRFYVDAVAETLSCSTLGKLRPGSTVNLERALRVGDPLGGHLVLGHVDGIVEVERVTRRGDDYRVTLALADRLERYVAFKGSIALQGVSLTVASRECGFFDVALVPETLSRTTLGSVRRGDRLNVEVDLLARYLERLTDGRTKDPGSPS